jgi:hypothetical protein
MTTKVALALRLAGCAAAAAFLPGCPNPDLYTTPRTIDPGTVQFQVALEGIGASYNGTQQTTTTNSAGNTTTQQQTVSESFFLPMVPTVGVRVGLADGLELGARIPNLDSLAADLKVRLLKGTLDLAIDPGLQGFYLSVGDTGGGILYFHVPLLVGFNVSKSVSLVATPGIGFAVASVSGDNGNSQQQVAGTSGVLGRLGFGVNIRLSKKFSLQPEVTFMKAFADTDALIYVFGLGFNVGAQPDYSDLDGTATPASDGAPAAAPAAAPAPAAQ